MNLDDLQQQWAAQGARVDELIRLNQRLLMQQALQPVRASLRRSQAGDVFEAVLAVPCLLCTGTFIGAHVTEVRFLVPGLAMHLWFIAVLVVAIVRCARKAALHYDAPVLAMQRQLEALQAFCLRALRVLFVTGVVVWGAPFWIVTARALAGWDVYAFPGLRMILYVLGGSVLLAVLTQAVCAFLSTRLPHSPALRAFTRNLAGYNLKVALERLERLAQLSKEEAR
jgi:hypothetical protein